MKILLFYYDGRLIFNYLFCDMKRTLSLFILLLLIQLFSAEKNYTSLIQDLQSAINNSRLPYNHYAYNELAYVVDTFGPRLWGSSNLEYVIDHMHKLAISEGFDNIRKEPVVNFTKWVRGKEYLTLLSPRPFPTKLAVTSLGFSVQG
jgi:carboxypeptidase Q